MDTERLARAYVKIRDARKVLNREFEDKDNDLKDKLKLIEGQMLKFLQDSKMDSAKTKSGTFYKQEEITPTGADWDKIYDWIKKDDAFDALEKRLKKTFVKEYMEAHKGTPPPGVTVYREFVVRVKRGD